jgi:transcriptional regulator
MYIPKNFALEDHIEALNFVKRFNFGTIVTTDATQKPLATHLPFIVEQSADQKSTQLISHLARENEQWQHFNGKEVLCIFHSPHAYISPEWYTREKSVPTWNYEAVHIYGKVKLIEDEKGVVEVLEKSIDFFDAGYREKWEKIDQAYKKKLYRALVAFSITVEEIQAVHKLSQDRNSQEKETIQAHLSNSTAEHEQMIAKSMKKLK